MNDKTKRLHETKIVRMNDYGDKEEEYAKKWRKGKYEQTTVHKTVRGKENFHEVDEDC